MLLESYYLRLNLAATPKGIVQVPDKFDAFFKPKNSSEKDVKDTTPPLIGQLEKPASSRATDVVYH